MGACHLCAEQTHIPDEQIVDHLRLLHPDEWADGFDRWPDDEIVVNDLTLNPSDFGEARADG
jgi:hypothetical protein